MSTPSNDQHGGGKEMISNTKECTLCEQNNNIDNITKDINSVVLGNMSTCASCGKEGHSDDMNTCNKCKMVKYCNASCKKKHRKKHKKACEKRVAEMHEEALFTEIEPEECPLCMLPLPIDSKESILEPCCGKRICNGCILAMGMSGGKDLCPFCRTPPTSSDEEEIERLNKVMNNGNGGASYLLAGHYANGRYGLPQDYRKAVELNLKAGECGYAAGYYNLGQAYRMGIGVEADTKKAKHYYELAVMNGYVYARHNLALIEGQGGNFQRAKKHFMIAARAGMKESLEMVKKIGFEKGILTKDEYEATQRAYHNSIDGMKSESRDKIAAILRNDE